MQPSGYSHSYEIKIRKRQFDKWLYENVNGTEKVVRKMKYNKEGDVVSDFTFAPKKITLQIKNKMPYRVGDTLSAMMKIEDAKYKYSEATVGFL